MHHEVVHGIRCCKYNLSYWWSGWGCCGTLKASLQFSQWYFSNHEKKIQLIDTNVSSLQATVNKHLQKTVYLENQSRRNNLCFEGLVEDDGEGWEETENKVKNLIDKLNFEMVPEIEHAHCTGRPRRQDGTAKPRTVVCRFTSYKAIRWIKPEGVHIFASKIWLRSPWRRGELNYHSWDKLKHKGRSPTSPSINW